MTITVAIVVTGVLAAAAASLTGAILAVRGQAMLNDAISHGVVLGIAVFYLALGGLPGPWRLVSAAVAALVTVAASEALSASKRVRADAAVALVFPAMFAAGVLLLGLFARDAHVDAHAVLLGEIGFVWLDSVSVFGASVPRAALLLALVFACDVAFYVVARRRLALAAFDPEQAHMQRQRPRLVAQLWLVLTAVTAVAAFDAVGVVLYVAFAIVPAVTGLLVATRLSAVIGVALAAAVAAAALGYPLAVRLDASIGGSMAMCTAVPLAVALLLRSVRARRLRGE
ncbi:MAG TPA: metal ABC transporter permease [Trueperaceae bacterium]|nr:metal ABC transporter permease [Trueperaceae bacterium]